MMTSLSPDWRIYYGDGSTFHCSEGTPFDAPRLNVQIIQQQRDDMPRGYGLIHGKDIYGWMGGELVDGVWLPGTFGWQGFDTAGMYDYLMMQPGPKVLLFGRTLHNEMYQKCVRRAQNEPL